MEGKRTRTTLRGVSVASLTKVDKDGYLTKQGGNIKNWKRRWCVLQDGVIYYFKTAKETKPQGTIELTVGSSVTDAEIKKAKFAFTIHTDTRDFVIYADTADSKYGWMEAITNAVSKKKQGSSNDHTHDNGASSRSLAQPSVTYSQTNGASTGTGAGYSSFTSTSTGKTDWNSPTPRHRLEAAKGTVSFLTKSANPHDEPNKVLEFWEIWNESIPKITDLGTGEVIAFEVACSATMQKLSWRTAGPQKGFIQGMVNFFWNVGAPETEIDRLNDVGQLINPNRIGSWIDMSDKEGMDGGWYFPNEMTVAYALAAADAGDCTKKVTEWAKQFGITKVISVGRDMGILPPRQTELRVELPGDRATQFQTAMATFRQFGFPEIPEGALKYVRDYPSSPTPIRLSIILSSVGFVRLGVLFPWPRREVVEGLCKFAQQHPNTREALMRFEQALCCQAGPEYIEIHYLMKDFGYNVYQEEFDIVLHYNVGVERQD